MNVDYIDCQYVMSYEHITETGIKFFEVPADKTLDVSLEVFSVNGGKAYVSILGSVLGLDSDWEYTVSVKEGEDLTDEQITAQEFELSKGSTRASINELAAGVVKAREAADEAIIDKAGAMEDADVLEAYAELDEADAEITEAYATLDRATNVSEISKALTLAERAKARASEAQASVEQAAEFLDDAPVIEEPVEDEPIEEEPVKVEPEGENYFKVEEEPARIQEPYVNKAPSISLPEPDLTPNYSYKYSYNGGMPSHTGGIGVGAIVAIVVLAVALIAVVIVLVVVLVNKNNKNYPKQ